MAEHTALPWESTSAIENEDGSFTASVLDAHNVTILTVTNRDQELAEADARFIVRACNSHGALLAMLEKCERRVSVGNDPDHGNRGQWPELVTEMRTVIAAARGDA